LANILFALAEPVPLTFAKRTTKSLIVGITQVLF
jgi:hypothetical protein